MSDDEGDELKRHVSLYKRACTRICFQFRTVWESSRFTHFVRFQVLETFTMKITALWVVNALYMLADVSLNRQQLPDCTALHSRRATCVLLFALLSCFLRQLNQSVVMQPAVLQPRCIVGLSDSLAPGGESEWHEYKLNFLMYTRTEFSVEKWIMDYVSAETYKVENELYIAMRKQLNP